MQDPDEDFDGLSRDEQLERLHLAELTLKRTEEQVAVLTVNRPGTGLPDGLDKLRRQVADMRRRLKR